MKQLLISDGTTAAGAYTNNVLAAGAVDVVGLSADGFTPLVGGETIADYPAIRLVQGTGTTNIFSPWIDGASVARWGGQAFLAQAAQVSTFTLATNSANAYDVSIGFANVTPGQAQFDRVRYTVNIAAAGQTPAQQIATIVAQLNAVATRPTLPDWIASVVDSGGGVMTTTGQTFDNAPYQYLSSFRTMEDVDGTNGTTATVATTTAPSRGNGGEGEFIVELEDYLQGMGRSFYNRVQLPNTPTSYAVAATNYDLYKLSFNNGTSGQINGVDNSREIIVAYAAAGAGQLDFQNKINPWLNSCPGNFAAVVL